MALYHGMNEWNKRKTEHRSQDLFAELDNEDMEDNKAEENLDNEFENIAAETFKHCTAGRSKNDEKISDLWGVVYAYNAGYKKDGLLSFFKRIKVLEDKEKEHLKKKLNKSKKVVGFSLMPNPVSHYSLDKRIEVIEDFLKKIKP